MHRTLLRSYNLVELLVKFLCKAANTIVFASILGIVLLLGGGVFLRYGFSYTPAFYEELAKLCLIWMTFAGAIIGMEKGDHVAIEMLVSGFKGPLKIFFNLLTQVLILVTAVLIYKYGLKFAKSGTLGVFTSMDWLPLTAAYAAVSVGYAGIAIIAIRNILRTFCHTFCNKQI